MNKPQRMKHDYTSELELKSLLIRMKNRLNDNPQNLYMNSKINKYILWHTNISKKKYTEDIKRKNQVKHNLKAKIIQLSEECNVDKQSYERFGEIILLMISRILTKPQFSGYTYRDDFFSDAIHKILKYNHNFNHKMISATSGVQVNSFAYISQIIHNSILYILNTKKKEQENIKQQISTSILDGNYNLKDYSRTNSSTYTRNNSLDVMTIHIYSLKSTLNDYLIDLNSLNLNAHRIKIYYPKDYTISFDEYELIKNNLNGNISVVKDAK